MKSNEKIRFRLIVGTILLIAVNAIRQIYERTHAAPENHQIYWLVYAVYMLCYIIWWKAINEEIVHRQMRLYLYLQDLVMMVTVTIRLIQEVAFHDIYPEAMRDSGYIIMFAVILLPLLGVYSIVYLGWPETYRLKGRWYLFWIPTLALLVMIFTNRYHHLIARDVFDEITGNVVFEFGPGGILLFAGAIVFLLIQIMLLLKKNGASSTDPIRMRMIPFYEVGFMILFSLPYLFNGFRPLRFELVEYSVGMMFIVVFCWELYVYLGLIPVNTMYEEVFRQSTIDMQILDHHGNILAAAENAKPITGEQFTQLIQEGKLYTEKDREMNLHHIPGGYVVWQNDLSLSNRVLRNLQETNQELEQEGTLLAQELRVRSGETNVQLRNDIYDNLTREVKTQLDLLNRFLDEGDETDPAMWAKVSLVGTYIKRFCNLQLTRQEKGSIPQQDFQICMKNLIACMKGLGIHVIYIKQPELELASEQILSAVRMLENILEENDFLLQEMRILVSDDVHFTGTAMDGSMHTIMIDRQGKVIDHGKCR